MWGIQIKNILFVIFILSIILLTGCSQNSSSTKTDAGLTEIVKVGDLSFTLLGVSLNKWNETYKVTTEPNGNTPAKIYSMFWSFSVINNGESVRYVSNCGALLFENGIQYNFAPDTEDTLCKEYTILPGARITFVTGFLFSNSYTTPLALSWEDIPGSKITYISKQTDEIVKYVIDKKDITYTGVKYIDPQNKNIQIDIINKTIILRSCDIENDKYIVANINLWSSPEMNSVKDSITHLCGGMKVVAYEQSVYDNKLVYHIKTGNNKDGWISEQFIQSEGVCKTNQDCRLMKESWTNGEYAYSLSYPACLISDSICVECITTRDCPNTKVCDVQKNKCVDCVTNNDCVTKNNSTYSKEEKICDTTTQRCTDCLTDKDCRLFEGDTGFCIINISGIASYNKCVICLNNNDCKEDEYCDNFYQAYSSCRKRT
ncbi:MAG: hypothetical protein WC916_03390 [Candidatus Woesearchaeota archaeon]